MKNRLPCCSASIGTLIIVVGKIWRDARHSDELEALDAHAEGLLGGAVQGARVTAMLTRTTSSEGLRRLTMAIWAGFAYDADIIFFR